MTDIAIKLDATLTRLTFACDTSAGDLEHNDGLLSCVLYSLFTDRSARSDDSIPDGSKNLRGHWGDAYLEAEADSEGSRLWLLDREKQTNLTLTRAVEYAREALQWLIDDGMTEAIEVDAEWVQFQFLGLRIAFDVIDGRRFEQTISM